MRNQNLQVETIQEPELETLEDLVRLQEKALSTSMSEEDLPQRRKAKEQVATHRKKTARA